MPRDEILIRRILGGWYVPETIYHSPLPTGLNEWYCYTRDGGHSILVTFPSHYSDEGDLSGKLCPAPVKSVLKAGFEIKRGYVVCDLKYSSELGLITDPGDDEF